MLDNLNETLTKNKFYAASYKNNLAKLKKLNALRAYKNKMPLTLTFSPNINHSKAISIGNNKHTQHNFEAEIKDTVSKITVNNEQKNS